MKKGVRRAIVDSVTHWRVDVLEGGQFPSSANCPMCVYQKKRYKDTTVYMCSDCAFSTSAVDICGDVYLDYCSHHTAHESTRKKYARIVIRSIEACLPKEGR